MKRRVRKIANFFAFNLLFFALYLNFIHKDKLALPVNQVTQTKPDAFSETQTVLVDNPEQYLKKKGNSSVAVNGQRPEGSESKPIAVTPLKLSIN